MENFIKISLFHFFEPNFEFLKSNFGLMTIIEKLHDGITLKWAVFCSNRDKIHFSEKHRRGHWPIFSIFWVNCGLFGDKFMEKIIKISFFHFFEQNFKFLKSNFGLYHNIEKLHDGETLKWAVFCSKCERIHFSEKHRRGHLSIFSIFWVNWGLFGDKFMENS